MTQFEQIRKVRNVLRVNGAATVRQIALASRIPSAKVRATLKVMGDAYVADYTTKDNKEIWELAPIPENAPKPVSA